MINKGNINEYCMFVPMTNLILIEEKNVEYLEEIKYVLERSNNNGKSVKLIDHLTEQEGNEMLSYLDRLNKLTQMYILLKWK